MLNRSLPHLTKSITTTIVNPFGVGKLILHYIRTVLNRIRWEENRELHSLQSRSTTLPRNTEQANKLFVATEQDLSLSEQARMQRIDRVHLLNNADPWNSHLLSLNKTISGKIGLGAYHGS